jgi:hypothetical protein
MSRSSSALVCVLMCTCFVQEVSANQKGVSNPGVLDGVYEFVSESVVLTCPEKSETKRTSSEWTGIWQFQNGYFSSTMMKRGQRDITCMSQRPQLFGYESDAGTYRIDGKYVELTRNFTINPLEVGRSMLMEYKINGDTLILVRHLHPYMENIEEGTVTIVLHKVK